MTLMSSGRVRDDVMFYFGKLIDEAVADWIKDSEPN